MKIATVPVPIQIKDPASKQLIGDLPIEQYANTFWLNNPIWLNPKTNILRLTRVQTEFEKKQGEVMEFEDADYDILVKAINEPDLNQKGQAILPQPLIYLQVQSYETIILEAKNK